MKATRLYRRLIGVSIRGQMQYRLSVAMRTVGGLLLTSGEFLAIWALFARFGSLGQWSLAEVSVFYGLVNTAFAVSKTITTGIEHVSALVRSGGFDRILLRPRSTALQLLGNEFSIRQTGRLAQGLTVLPYGLITTSAPTVATAFLLPWALTGAVSLFGALALLEACLSFKTIEALEVANIFTYGGASAAGYPMAIFERWFRRFFFFVIPLGAVSYYPALILAGTPDPLGGPSWIGWLTPLAGFASLALALMVWRRALRWYSSTGS